MDWHQSSKLNSVGSIPICDVMNYFIIFLFLKFFLSESKRIVTLSEYVVFQTLKITQYYINFYIHFIFSCIYI